MGVLLIEVHSEGRAIGCILGQVKKGIVEDVA